MRSYALALLLLAAPASAQQSSAPASTAPFSGGIGVQIDSQHWYIDFSLEMLSRSMRHRRIAVSADYFMASSGSTDIGLELTYWRLGFRRRTAFIDGIQHDTERQGRAIMMGPVVRRPGPWHTEINGALLAGWYDNRLDSATFVDNDWTFEPLADAGAAIAGTRFGMKFPTISGRIIMEGSVRYFRLFGTRPDWVPTSEWSGETAVSVRTFSVRKKAVFVGALVRFGPRGPGLVTDRTFGIRMKWKLR